MTARVMSAPDPRVGFAANAIWRALNPGDRKTPPAEFVEEYRAAGRAVIDGLALPVDDDTDLAERVEHITADLIVARNNGADWQAAAQATKEQLSAELAAVQADLKHERQVKDEVLTANLELTQRYKEASAHAHRLQQENAQLREANRTASVAMEAHVEQVKPRVQIRWLIPRHAEDTTLVEYGHRQPHHVRITPCSKTVAEHEANNPKVEVVCRQVSAWEPAKPSADGAAAPSSNGHAKENPRDASEATYGNEPKVMAGSLPAEDRAARFRSARARLAGTAKLRDDDPRKIAAHVAFNEAKAALNGGAQ